MRRTAFVSRGTITPKPGRCKHCRKRLDRIGDKIHSDCLGPWIEANKGKFREQALKAERKKDRECKKVANPPNYLALAQKAFNAFVRERDKDQPCICCGREKTQVNGLRAHGWDAGHYRSRGSAPHLRFNEDNCHRQLVYCNQFRSGNAVDYRLRLIERIGLERVEALEADQTARHYTDDDYIAIAALYRAKLKALREQQENT